MNSGKQIYLILAVFIFGFYTGQATNSPELDNWKFLIELGSILGGVGSIGVLIIAYQAMLNWKKTQSQGIIIETAIEVEDLLTKYYLACISEPEELSQQEDLLLYSEIVLLIWRLKRRGFSLKELKKIEDSLHEVAVSLREKKEIPEHVANTLLENLNSFSRTF
ncbi:hypothetical protein [Vibrio cyclitrophicus]